MNINQLNKRSYKKNIMEITKLFFDTEFTGLRQDTTLISIGIVSDNNKIFYAEFTDYNQKHIDEDEWLKDNVISNLIFKSDDQVSSIDYDNMFIKGCSYYIKTKLKLWLKMFNKIEMWSDCLAYDWVLFNNIFEHALKIPKNIYYIPFDICTLFKIKGIDPDISREEFTNNINIELPGKFKNKKHNSLYDAFIIKNCYNKLISEGV